jgi:hypothetical protein
MHPADRNRAPESGFGKIALRLFLLTLLIVLSSRLSPGIGELGFLAKAIALESGTLLGTNAYESSNLICHLLQPL